MSKITVLLTVRKLTKIDVAYHSRKQAEALMLLCCVVLLGGQQDLS